METIFWKKQLYDGSLDGELAALYGECGKARERYEALVGHYVNLFGEAPAVLCSAPGRTELCGNHTDHQQGRVLCGSVAMDTLAAAAPSGDLRGTIHSQGFGEISLTLDDLSPRPEEKAPRPPSSGGWPTVSAPVAWRRGASGPPSPPTCPPEAASPPPLPLRFSWGRCSPVSPITTWTP